MRRADSGWRISTFILAGGLLLFQASGAIAQQQMPQGMMGPGMMGSGPMGQGMMGPGMTGPGMMGSGMMGSGAGCPGMTPGGMMHHGMMGHHGGAGSGMMGPGMMGQGMMGQAMMGQAMMGQGMMHDGMAGRLVMVPAPPLLTIADVTYNLEQLLATRGNARLKVGPVTDKDATTITGDIVTSDGSLVERYEVDKRSGVAEMVP